IALGITFIYSIMKMINWGMGEFYMIGSYVQYALIVSLFGPRQWYLALPMAMGAGFLPRVAGLPLLPRPVVGGGFGGRLPPRAPRPAAPPPTDVRGRCRAAGRVCDGHHDRVDGPLPEPRHRPRRAEPVRSARLRAPRDARHASHLGQPLRRA